MAFDEMLKKTLAFRGVNAPYQIVYCSLASTFGWAVLFGLVRLLTRFRLSFLSSWRCLRFLHSVLIMFSADRALITGSIPFVESAGRNTPNHNLTLTLSAGFLLFSTVSLWVTKLDPPRMLRGYIFYIFYIAGNFFFQECGAELMIGILVMESAALLSQFREILRCSLLSENGWIFKTLDWMYLLVLLFLYLFIGTLSFLLTTLDPYINPFVKLGYLVSYILCMRTLFFTGKYFKQKYFTKHKFV